VAMAAPSSAASIQRATSVSATATTSSTTTLPASGRRTVRTSCSANTAEPATPGSYAEHGADQEVAQADLRRPGRQVDDRVRRQRQQTNDRHHDHAVPGEPVAELTQAAAEQPAHAVPAERHPEPVARERR